MDGQDLSEQLFLIVGTGRDLSARIPDHAFLNQNFQNY